MTFLLAVAIDVGVVAAAALLAVATMRRHPAALRHVILALAFVAAAGMPLLEVSLPPVPIVPWPSTSAAVSSSMSMSSAGVTADPGTGLPAVSEATSLSWPALVAVVWLAGVLTVIARLARGFVHLARLDARTHAIEDGRWRDLADEIGATLLLRRPITIRRSPDPTLLIAYGVCRPRLVVPAAADDWSDERLRMVLTHELEHIRRHDPATMLLAAVVCALHWFNPLVWLCARRLRRESECACDDAVLRGGVEPTRYAALLLSVARGAAGRRPWIAAPAIAHPSTLERRIAAMLQRQRNRAPLTRPAKALVAIAIAAIVMPLAAAGIAPGTETSRAMTTGNDVSLEPVQAVGVDATPAAAPAGVPASPSPTVRRRETDAARSLSLFRRMRALDNVNEAPDASAPAAAPATAVVAAPGAAAAQDAGAISATAVDSSGGVLPGVTARLFDPSRGFEVRTTVTDANGRFEFRDVLVGQYELTLALAGFATVHTTLPVTRDATVTRRLMLPIGTVEETISVGCSARAAADAGPGLIARVGFMLPGEQARRQLWARGLAAFMPVLSAQEPARGVPVRVGGNVQAPRKVKDVRPVCPVVVPATGATVKLAARIGVDGLMNDVTPVSSAPDVEPPSEVTQSALDAVRQWTFTPTRLNGQIVETNINIRISYR